MRLTLLVVTILFSVQSLSLFAQNHVIRGYVQDSTSGIALSQCTVLFLPSNISVKTDKNGFFISQIPYSQKIDVVFSHQLYKETKQTIFLRNIDTTSVKISLLSSTFSTKTILVEDDHFHNGIRQGESDILVSGDYLRKNLMSTIGETMKNIPGISVQSMGASTSRPTLRGMGMDRVLLFEDGQKSGDMSATSADHAVSIDPQSIDHIEVIRGPMAFLYSSNATGGIINVTRNTIPTILPNDIQASTQVFGESVSRLASATGKVEIPLSKFSLRGDASYKNNQPYFTPIGLLRNTQSSMLNTSIGGTYFGDRGYLGGGFSFFTNDYGIPPDSLLGHPNGVTVSMMKSRFETKSEMFFPENTFSHIEVLGSFIDYFHKEIEANGRIGMSFSLKTTSLTALSDIVTSIKDSKTKVGLWFEHRNFQSGGLTFTPNTNEYSSALMMYHSFERNKFSFDMSLRYDIRSILPFDNDSSVAGKIETKLFSNLSGAFEVVYNKHKEFSFGGRLLRTFRSPMTEELFSEGPHLAAYSFDVGNASLEQEIGSTFEVFATVSNETLFSKMSIYGTYFQNFIIPVNTGQRSLRRNDLFLYQYIGQDAVFLGYEFQVEWKLSKYFNLGANSFYTYARFVESQQYVPRIPPLISTIDCIFRYNSFETSIGLTNGLAQRNLGDFETVTPGYRLVNFKAQYHFQWNSSLHTLSFSVLNATNQLYRNHLNRIKDAVPEQGVNARLLYSVFL